MATSIFWQFFFFNQVAARFVRAADLRVRDCASEPGRPATRDQEARQDAAGRERQAAVGQPGGRRVARQA